MTSLCISRRTFIASTVGTGIIAAGCTTTTPESQSGTTQTAQANPSRRAEIDAGVSGAIAKLNQQEPGSRQMMQQAKGMLVFPSIFKAGLVVGGEHGDGALRVGGQTVGYYSATAGSIGLQAGAQEKSVFILFMTEQALAQFRQSSGWTAGADASVAMINVGASGTTSTEIAQRPVVGYVLTQGGLMVDASVNGTKISRLDI